MILSISNINTDIVQVILIFDFTLNEQWLITHTKGLTNMYGKQLVVNVIVIGTHKVYTNIGTSASLNRKNDFRHFYKSVVVIQHEASIVKTAPLQKLLWDDLALQDN